MLTNRMYIICFILFYNTTVGFCQSNYKHNISFAYGYTAYMTSFSVPSGLPGNSFVLLYDYNHSLFKKDNRLLYFSSRIGFSQFQNKQVDTDFNNSYSHRSFDINGHYLWKVPLNADNLKFYSGFGTSLDAYYIYPTGTLENEDIYTQTYGNWGLSAELSLKIIYKFRSLIFENYFHLPIVKVGHFPLYQIFAVWTDNDLRYYFTPNTIAWIGNYQHIDNQLRATIPYKNIAFSISYLFQYQHSNVNKNKELYSLHALGLGVTF